MGWVRSVLQGYFLKVAVAVGVLALAGVPINGATASTSAVTFRTVSATVTSLDGGGSNYSYILPDGSVMNVPVPPASFSPLTATSAKLSEYDFPPRPTDSADFSDWTTAMAAYISDGAPSEQFSVASGGPSSDRLITYGNYAGFGAGTKGVSNTTYVGIKGDETVPSHTGTCGSTNNIGVWVGLGGLDPPANDLVQQGIICGNSLVGSGGAFRPFTEFANTQDPIVFCGETSWTFPAGDVIYQNMSYYTSLNEANFYLEDETTGVPHSCSIGEPASGWSFNGATAEWIVEAPGADPAPLDYGTIPFSDANAYLESTGKYVTLGSQSTIKFVEGDNSTTYCFSPSTIGGDEESFTVSWNSSTCY